MRLAACGECPTHASMELTARPDLVILYAGDGLDKDPGREGQPLLLKTPRANLLRFMPALTMSADGIDRVIDGVRIAIQAERGDATRRSILDPADGRGP